jgi:hypothetical protein
MLTWILKGRKLSASVALDRPELLPPRRGGEGVVVKAAVVGIEYEVEQNRYRGSFPVVGPATF